MSQPPPRLRLQALEDRVTPSWASLPPATVTLPANPVAVTLNPSGDASINAAITANEVDWYRVTVASGTSVFTATTPASNLDSVLGVYSAAGKRVASNDDVSYPLNTDSRVSVTLAAGTYFVGVTNFNGRPGGSYTVALNSPPVVPVAPPSPPGSPPGSPPTVPPPGVPPTTPPTVPPSPTAGFDITLRATGMTASQLTVFRQASARWSQLIVGDLPNATFNGLAVDDLLIDASSVPIDGRGGILGQAGPDVLRSGTQLPIHGIMQFDSADLAALETSGQLFATVFHEMGHVIGIGTIWESRGLLSGAGTANPRFVGVQATEAYNQIFGRTETSVPVENTGGPGTADGHWRETVFGNEVMTGFLNSGANPVSRVTVASLGDLGYRVNLAAADVYAPPVGGALVAGPSGSGTGAPAGRASLLAAYGNVAFDLPRVRVFTPGDNWNGVSVG